MNPPNSEPSSCELSHRDEASWRLALAPGVGPILRQVLMDRFGTAENVLRASPGELREVPGVGHQLTSAIAWARAQVDVQAQWRECCQHGIQLITWESESYPRLLREIPDPPGILFQRGPLTAQDAVAVAVVGTRHASSYGMRQAERLAGSLARAGVTVVSGLARGIDAAAHRGALAAGGRTLAVLAGGLSEIYPKQHLELAEEIVAHGALLSESAPGQAIARGSFPRRNRIITGLALGVVVVEASQRSGALISARHASEQGRDVFAVPGRVDSRTAHGCHQLLRDGAKLVETADDILEELGPLVEVAVRPDGNQLRQPAELLLNDQEQCVLQCIGSEPTSIEEIVAHSQLPVHRVLSTLGVLEMRRLVRRFSGTQVARY